MKEKFKNILILIISYDYFIGVLGLFKNIAANIGCFLFFKMLVAEFGVRITAHLPMTILIA